MSEVTRNFIIIVSMIVVSMTAGYLLRRTRFPSEKAAEWIMTAVGVAGYSLVGFLAIWQLRPDGSAFWLPAMAAVHTVVLCVLGIAAGRRLLSQPGLRGLLAMSAGAGNNGFTMGGFIIYLLMGEVGLGLVTMYGLVFTPLTALVFYPIARHYTHDGPPQKLSRLMLKSVLDWRSIGLPLTLAGLALSYANVHRPAFVSDYHLIDALIFTITPMAYFAIGLRLHVSDIASSRRIIAALAGLRFLAGPLVGLALVGITCLTPWPMGKLDQKVFIIESFVPTAVTMVAVANMFRLEPRKASMLFIVNTLMYLVFVLPVVLWLFGQ